MKKFNPHNFDTSILDKSILGTKSDAEIAKELGISDGIVCYWRVKWGIPSFAENQAKERQEMFDEGFHWCSKCQQYKTLDNFSKSKRDTFGYKTHCRECRAQYIKDNQNVINEKKRVYYSENREDIRAKQTKYNNRTRQQRLKRLKLRHAKLRTKYVSMFGSVCERCGYCEFLSGLEFHHVNPDEKDETPVKAIVSGNHERIVKELDKCCLLCRNCHMAFHAGDWSANFIKRDDIGWKIEK